ncbi:DUF4435 domain-containing protein [uncultured Vibrio sp.]|uniref:DUF4435 domain-containing protein n=1 Tax=uncultured Vibrio sp. TaxID=114054 RepID=UPI0026247D3C|nr:DUF4435 domain-containing protein [uncultured Vibrio sp.]
MNSSKITFDIPQYIAQVKMSSKTRLLVEGRDDRTHISNLLHKLGRSKVRIDTAEQIKGNCQQTAKNNRKKIDVIHDVCRGKKAYSNLYYLADREFEHFHIDSSIEDQLSHNSLIDNLCFTSGHSMENYFINSMVLQDAYSYLCSSEYKHDALADFERVLASAYQVVAAISLAARDLGKATFPIGVIPWEAFQYTDENLQIDPTKMRSIGSNIYEEFLTLYEKWLSITKFSTIDTCEMICRGHTAIIMLQRVFSSCLYSVAIKDEDANEAAKIAENFSKLSESQLSCSLGEAWIRKAAEGESRYPQTLVQAIA